MGKKALLSEKELSPCCGYCEHANPAPDGEHVLCAKRGVMLPDSSCPKFSYDPLMRIPRQPLKLPDFNEEEFRL